MNKNDQNKKSLKISYYKGIFGCCMTGFTQEYFTPFLLHLGAAVTQIGVFNSLANFFASLIQLISAELTEHLKSRKKVIGLCIVLQTISLIVLTWAAYRGVDNYFFVIIVVVACICF